MRGLGGSGRRVVARRGGELVRQRNNRRRIEARRRSDRAPRFLELRSRVPGDRDRPRGQTKHALEEGTRPPAGQLGRGDRNQVVVQDHHVAAGSGRALVCPKVWMRPESAADEENVLDPEARFRRPPRRRKAATRELQSQQRPKRQVVRLRIEPMDVGVDVGGGLRRFFAKTGSRGRGTCQGGWNMRWRPLHAGASMRRPVRSGRVERR